MRKDRLTLISTLLICTTAVFAQAHQSEAAVRALKEDLTRAGNNTNSYEFKEMS